MSERASGRALAHCRARLAATGSSPTSFALAAIVCVALGAASASAQFAMLEETSPSYEWRGRLATSYRNEFSTKSDAGDEFDAWRVEVEGGVEGPINQSILVGFQGGYRHARYDFDLDGSPPGSFGTALPRDPWNTVNSLDFLPNATVLVGSRVAVIAAVPIRWAAETGADRNGFAAGVSALVRWQVSDALSLGAGIGVTSQLEGDAETFPLISLRWRISESLELTTQGGWFQGGRTALLWGPNPAIRLSLSAGYERLRFRLDDNGNAADRNGIGEVTTIPIEVGLRLQLIPEAILEIHAGLGVEGRLRVETDSGRKLYDQTYDPAPRVGFSLTFPIGLPARTASEPRP